MVGAGTGISTMHNIMAFIMHRGIALLTIDVF